MRSEKIRTCGEPTKNASRFDCESLEAFTQRDELLNTTSTEVLYEHHASFDQHC